MAPNKDASVERLIDANEADPRNLAFPIHADGGEYSPYERGYNDAVISCYGLLMNAHTVDAVPAKHFNALKSLVNGEWVDCKLVEEALGIDFATGLKMFSFSRTAEWNPAPLNGQKITTKFRLKNAMKVVRCGECQFANTDNCPMRGTLGRVPASNFCSFGERRQTNEKKQTHSQNEDTAMGGGTGR